MARKKLLRMPYSNMDFAVAKILKRTGYVKNVEKKVTGKKKYIDIDLAYPKNRYTLLNFRIVSKPSRHVYVRNRDLYPVRHGCGLAVLSTPEGVMTNRDAKKKGLGGEYLFEVW